MRKFGDTAISRDALGGCIESGERRIQGLGDVQVHDFGRRVLVEKDDQETRRCFVLVDGSCKECTQCEECTPTALAAPIYWDDNKGSIRVKCCDAEPVSFLYMSESDLKGLRRFHCSNVEGNPCLCLATVNGECHDTSGCLVFCAFWDSRANRWESEYRPPQTLVARAERSIAAGTDEKVGCGTAQPMFVFSKEDAEAADCCNSLSVDVFDDTVSIPRDDHPFEIREVYKKPFKCPLYCVTATLSGTYLCGHMVIRDGVHEEEAAFNSGVGKVCVAGGSQSTVKVELDVYLDDSVTVPDPSLVDVVISIAPMSDPCSSEECPSVVADSSKAPVEVLNTGGLVPKGSIITISKSSRCNYAVTNSKTFRPRPCCLGDLGFSKYASVTFRGVEESLISQVNEEPWAAIELSPCHCTQCHKWNDTFTLEWNPQMSPGAGECSYALSERCYVDGLYPCGPYNKFPCEPAGAFTGIFLSASCSDIVGVIPCGSSGKELTIVEFAFKIRGQTLMTFGWPSLVDIPEEGDVCVTATAVTGATTEWAPHGPCAQDMSSLVPNRLPDFYKDEFGELFLGTAEQFTWPNPTGDELQATHDVNDCLWNFSTETMPTICFHRI